MDINASICRLQGAGENPFGLGRTPWTTKHRMRNGTARITFAGSKSQDMISA